MRTETRKQSMVLFSWECEFWELLFSPTVCMFMNHRESAVSIDFEVTSEVDLPVFVPMK